MKRTPMTWLVVDVAKDHAGRPVALLGRASYDGDADLLTVTSIGPARRVSESTQGGHTPLTWLAKVLLRDMYRDGRIIS